VRVFKSERRLELVNENNQVIKTYKIMLGKNPIGHKEQEGDNKTPEGDYILDMKNPQSSFFKSLHISYPNFKDKMKAKLRGVSPGGDIMIHGLPNDFKEMTSWLETIGLGDFSDDLIRASITQYDWTSGCIAVTDEEIAEIYDLIDVPTKILIRP
jgi:murein L,D-transpeptidase YafK